MAIPFQIPTPQETEDSYRLIYQLLNDLCDLLRQIVIGQRQLLVGDPPQPASRNRSNGGRRVEVRMEMGAEASRTEVPVLPLPDVVLSTIRTETTTSTPSTTSTSSNCTEQPPQRPPRRRRRTTRVPVKQPIAPREDWVKVGEDLRNIADEFRATLREPNRKPPAEPSLKAQNSLLSLLLPAPLRGSLWTAVILLLGWKLFHAAH
ncbi:uncharacterized protein [Anabrus simplex]|uniref:uncharacterized protein n=1 Tax=Anabrus simplex TaxID=316456 RepID=UPI0034DD44E6